MRLRVRHRTVYRFDVPQARLVQLLRLTPSNHEGQTIIEWGVEVDRNARLRRGRDGYGNRTIMLYVDGPLTEIAIEVDGMVLTEDRAGVVAGVDEPLPPLAFLQSTPLTTADAAVHAFVADCALPEDSLARAHALTAAVHARLSATDADPDADHSAAARLAAGAADARGSAHLLIAAARAAGMPARYVAGHLFRPDATAGHAAHGWAELHVAGYGWIGFDPALGCCPSDRHVRVAIGLDHAQAAPVVGAREGRGEEMMRVDVRVEAQRTGQG